MHPLDISFLKPEEAVFQLTYPFNFTLWDNVGTIWTHMKTKFPTLEFDSSEPNKQVFHLQNRFDFSLEINKLRVIEFDPKSSLEEFRENIKGFVSVCSSIVNFDIVERIGFRQMFYKEFNSNEEAAKKLNSGKLFSFQFEKLFNFDGTILYPKMSFRWEGKTLGARIEIHAENRKLDLTPPKPANWHSLKNTHLEKAIVIYDVDYYTLVKTNFAQLDIDEWIKQANSAMKSNFNKILGI